MANNKAETSNNTTATSSRKTYNTFKLRMKKEDKRFDAELRQKAYNELSVDDRIAQAKSRRGNSKREIARLQAKIPTPVITEQKVSNTETPNKVKVNKKVSKKPKAVAPSSPTKS